MKGLLTEKLVFYLKAKSSASQVDSKPSFSAAFLAGRVTISCLPVSHIFTRTRVGKAKVVSNDGHGVKIQAGFTEIS